MSNSLSLQKLSLMVFDNALLEPVEIRTLQEELRNPGTQGQAMRTAVSMIQQGHDLSAICSDVLKIIDTADPKLKLLCSVYLRRHCADRPACQLMCTHTFLKDFNDRSWSIQRTATTDAVFLADDVIIKNYIYDLKRMCMHERGEVRAAAARSLSIFCTKSSDLFLAHGLDRVLRAMVEDECDVVAVAALQAVAAIEQAEGCRDIALISISDVKTLIEKSHRKTHRLRAAMGVLAYKKVGVHFKETLRKLIHSADVAIFYTAANKLLEIDKTAVGDVFEQACGFLDLRDEQLYNMLLYIESLADSVEYNNSLFTIHYNDPDYIKKIKIGILFRNRNPRNLDQLSDQIHDHKFNIQVFSLCLKHNRVMPEVLDSIASFQLEEFFGVILESASMSGEWLCILSRFVHECISVDKNGVFRVHGKEEDSAADAEAATDGNGLLCKSKPAGAALEAAGRLCATIPDWIFRVKPEAHTMGLVRFFCVMMYKQAISKGQCVNYLKNLRREAPHLRRIKFIIRNIDQMHPDDVARGWRDTPPRYFDDSCGKPGNSELVVCETGVLEARPYAGNPVSAKHGELDDSLEAENDPSGNFRIVRELPLLIDIPGYRGILDITGTNCTLRTDAVEGEMTVMYGVEGGIKKSSNPGSLDVMQQSKRFLEYSRAFPNAGVGDDFGGTEGCSGVIEKDCVPDGRQEDRAHSDDALDESFVRHEDRLVRGVKIDREGEKTLFKIEASDINKSLRFTINEYTYFIAIDVYKLIKPHLCDSIFLENSFAELKDYIMLDSFDMANAYIVNDTSFCFTILGNIVCGKSFSNQIVLKGDAAILDGLKR